MAHPEDIQPGDLVEFATPSGQMMGMQVTDVRPIEAYELFNETLGMSVTVLGTTEIRILPKGTQPK
jgi:cell wall-associated NlpC family hydrolase